jgi:hypothetical protein
MAAANKTKREEVPVADFIATVANPQKRADAETVCALMARLSGETPYMYGPTIIGFGTYHYRYESGHEGDAPRIGFSPRSSALTFYLKLSGARSEALLARLGKHKTSKACLYVNKLADVDMGVLEELVRHSVEAMDEAYPRAD